MATVKMQLRGGPFSGQVVTMDIPDADNPPEVYTANVHGPHERAGTYQYRRVGRGPDRLAGAETWIYEASTLPS
jgi:hypothetical protein